MSDTMFIVLGSIVYAIGFITCVNLLIYYDLVGLNNSLEDLLFLGGAGAIWPFFLLSWLLISGIRIASWPARRLRTPSPESERGR